MESLGEMTAEWLQYRADFCPQADALQWFRQLMQETSWQQPQITLFGRTQPVPRLTAWYGDEAAQYQYSGIEHQPLPWTSLLNAIKQKVESETGDVFNSVLLNLYRDGADSNGWHADDEPEISAKHGIASLSLGAERRFRLRTQQQPRKSLGYLELQSGSLLYMRPGAQQALQHCISKTRRPVGPRINLTFRFIAPL